MRNPSDKFNRHITGSNIHGLVPTDHVYGGRCEAPFLIRQIHSRPASYTYTPRVATI